MLHGMRAGDCESQPPAVLAMTGVRQLGFTLAAMVPRMFQLPKR